MTDIELKLKLAKELPELIDVVVTGLPSVDRGLPPSFIWLDTRKEITEREWDWVVNEVVNRAFMASKIHKLEHNSYGWQQRAEAYFKV